MEPIENHMVIDSLWERRQTLECGCEGRCQCDDDDERDL